MWSRDASCLTVRPVARHPERWRAWRLRRYFALAHDAADATARLVAQRAVAAADADRRDRLNVSVERVAAKLSNR